MAKEKVREYKLSDIKDRGWTDTMVKKLLPEPRLQTNPVYKTAPPMKLWKAELIEAVEQTDEFKELFAKAEKRRASSDKAFDTKYDDLMKIVEKKIKNIKIRKIDDSDLIEYALNMKDEEFRRRNIDYAGLSREDIDEHIDRWVVNVIRHELSNYDRELETMKGKVGISDAYYKYRNAVLDEIAKIYPKYAEECERLKDSEDEIDMFMR